MGEPETLLVDSTLLEVLHPRQVSQSAGWGSFSAGAAWVRWGSFSVYGVKLHLLCATNRVPLSYELTPANVADISLSEELIYETALGEGVARKLLGDLAYRSEDLREALAEVGILLATERAERRHGVRQQIRDCSFEPQEGLWVGRDFGYHARWVGYQDRGQDSSLHLRLCGQQDVGTPSR